MRHFNRKGFSVKKIKCLFFTSIFVNVTNKKPILVIPGLNKVKSIFTRFFVFFLLFVIYSNGNAQNIQISSRSEHIQVLNDTTYTVEVSVLLKATDEALVFPIFYDHELEKVSNIKVYRKRRNSFREIKEPETAEETIELDYITSKRVLFILVPPGDEAKITYTISCSELMYFADLRFFSLFDTDTLKYRVSVPEQFWFSYTTTHTDLLEYLTIDSVKIDQVFEWKIEITPVKVDPDPLMFFGIYRNRNLPIIRTIVVPQNYKNKEKIWLNNWFLTKSESSKGLDSIAMQKIDELTYGITDQEQILEIIYEFVKYSFKYVSIQIGLGAFIPSHVNEVFINKQGDCKDLSNFLCEALNYKGIESHLALAATYNHISDCDFPSLGSANHVVCVAYIDGKQILLDPTDPVHLPNKPVQSMQGRTILVTNPRGGEFQQVEAFSPQQNKISYEIELKACSDQSFLEGGFSVLYEGISGNFLKRSFLDQTRDRKNHLARQHFQRIFNNQLISGITVFNHPDSIVARGKLSVRGKVFNDVNRQFLFLDFAPRLIESQQRETLLDGTYIGNTMKKKVKLLITMDRDFKYFDPVSHVHEEDGVSLNLTISNPSGRIISYEYIFVLDHIFMDEENTKHVNNILNAFKKLSDEPIILQGKI